MKPDLGHASPPANGAAGSPRALDAASPGADRATAAEPPADWYAVQPEPIDPAGVWARVTGPGYGAVATFAGTVRDTFGGRRVVRLEYEAYAPMALEVLRGIGRGLRSRHELGRIAIVHRTGPLEVGEVSVAIAVSAPHRRAALDACGEAIERLKASLPVWKKEVFEGGEEWRENRPLRGPA